MSDCYVLVVYQTPLGLDIIRALTIGRDSYFPDVAPHTPQVLGDQGLSGISTTWTITEPRTFSNSFRTAATPARSRDPPCQAGNLRACVIDSLGR